MIEVLNVAALGLENERFDKCLELRRVAQKADVLAYGQTSLYANFIDNDDGPHSLHILNSKRCGHLEAYARLVPSESALTDAPSNDQNATTTFRWVEPASIMLLQRVSILATDPARRARLLKEILLAAVEVARGRGMELLGGLATQAGIEELSSIGLNVVTIGKSYEDNDRVLVRYHFACDDQNRAALRPMMLVDGQQDQKPEMTISSDNLLLELARVAAAHQTRTQVKVALRLVSSDVG